jgi:pimeloyl-ACP methyl ester carboxylesterase
MKKATSLLLFAAFVFATFAACSKKENATDANPQTYVLVHGAWQAPYVWNSVRTNLEQKGHKVIVVELPGHGNDHTPPQHLSLDVYRDKVIDAMSTIQGKVILVGHSMAGMVITHVAEKVPSKISQLAFLPSSGQAIADLAPLDTDSKLGGSLVPSADQLTLDVKRDSLTWLFINDGTEADKQKVIANYRPEPAIPFGNKVTLSPENFGSVPKVYIKTLQDIVISPALQDRMIAAAGIKAVYSINSSHSPFLSQPKAVSDILIEIAQEYSALPETK